MNRPTAPSSPLDGLEDCPEVDTLAQYAEGVLGDRRRPGVDAHVARCDRCRGVVAAAARAGLVAPGAVAGAAEGRLVRFPRWVAVAAAAAVLATALVVWRASEGPRPEGTEARLVAATERLRSQRPDLFSGLRPLDAAERRAGGDDVLRGGVDDMAPAGVTVETRPTFSWAEVDGATGYAVSIVDAQGERLLSTTVGSARLDGSALGSPLARGGDYVWKVVAVGAPTPAQGTTALRVASAADAKAHGDVVAAVAAAVEPPLRDLVTANALVRRGLVADALPFARRFAEARPSDDVGRETLALVRRRLAAAGRPR